MIGKINVLAPIVTIPFLLTYATVEYAYFSLAMTFDIQIMRESRFMANAEVSSPTFDTSGKIKSTKHTDYGSVKVKNCKNCKINSFSHCFTHCFRAMIWTDYSQKEFNQNVLLLKDNKAVKTVAANRLQKFNHQMIQKW